jgi:membrane associated rhomboid family serine protease
MIRPPSIATAAYFPMTATLCGAALIIAIGQLMGGRVDMFVLNDSTFWSKPWQLLTTGLLHRGPFHLIFAVFWVWTFGTVIEHTVGWRGWLFLYLTAAVASASMDYVVYGSAFSLSGVVYAFFGFLWVLSARVPRMSGAVDSFTVKLFLAFFVIGFALQMMNVSLTRVASDVTGFTTGLLMGLAFTAKGLLRTAAIGAVGVVLSVPVTLAHMTVHRGNMAVTAQSQNDRAEKALLDEDYARAEQLATEALLVEPGNETAYFMKARAQVLDHRFDAAVVTLDQLKTQAAEGRVNPQTYSVIAAMVAVEAARSPLGMLAGNIIEYSLNAAPDDPATWLAAGIYYQRISERSEAVRALVRAEELANSMLDGLEETVAPVEMTEIRSQLRKARERR